MSFNINEIKIMLDTNIPKKEPVPFTKALLYNPLIKKTDDFNEYPYLTLDVIYPATVINALPYEKKVEFFFNKDKMNLLLQRNVEIPKEINESFDKNSSSKNQSKIDESTIREKKELIQKIRNDTSKSNIIKNEEIQKIIDEENDKNKSNEESNIIDIMPNIIKPTTKNDIGKENILIMLKCLFPTGYPTHKNISDSFSTLIEGNMHFWDDLEFTDILPDNFKNVLYPEQTQYSYLKIDDKIYTVTQLIWVNDIYNHEKYKKIIKSYKELGTWKKDEIKKLNNEIKKKQMKFQTEFKMGGTFHIGTEDIEKLKSQLVDPRKDENLRYSSAYAEKLDIFERLTKIIDYIEDLNTYIELDSSNYNRINDIANNIKENYSKISSKLSANKQIDKKFKELNQQIESINTLEKINDNYLSKPGINMNFENDEPEIKNTLKNKYGKYTNFSTFLSEFIKPKMESTNYELQKTFDEFLDNTDNLQLFNAIMDPKYINEIERYLSEIKKDTTLISLDKYQKRLDTGILIFEGNEKEPNYEIIVRVELIAGEIKNDTKSKINCLYKGESLGDTLDKLLNAKFINKWELNTNRFFIDLTDKLLIIEKELEEKRKKEEEERKKKESKTEETEEKKGGRITIYKNTRKLRSLIIKTRKRL